MFKLILTYSAFYSDILIHPSMMILATRSRRKHTKTHIEGFEAAAQIFIGVAA
jgi:hypothetical protein